MRKLDLSYKEEIGKIIKELPVRKGKDGTILLDKNDSDDLKWWNDD